MGKANKSKMKKSRDYVADYMALLKADLSSNMQTNTYAKVYLFAKKIGGKANKSKMGGKVETRARLCGTSQSSSFLPRQVCKIIEKLIVLLETKPR